jgi:hypothetical protein
MLIAAALLSILILQPGTSELYTQHRSLPIAAIPDAESNTWSVASQQDDSTRHATTLTVYVLDTMDLAMLGIYVEPDGSVYLATSSRTMKYESMNSQRTQLGRPQIENNAPIPNSARALAYSRSRAPVEVYWSDLKGRTCEHTEKYKQIQTPMLAGQQSKFLQSPEVGGGGMSRIYGIVYVLETGLEHCLAELIPIRLPMPSLEVTGTPKAERYEILWYDNSPALLECLPRAIRTHIESARNVR